MGFERKPNDRLALVGPLRRKFKMGKVAVNCLLGLGQGVTHPAGPCCISIVKVSDRALGPRVLRALAFNKSW